MNEHPTPDAETPTAPPHTGQQPRPIGPPRTVLHLIDGIDLQVQAHPMNHAGGDRDWFTVTTAGGAGGVVVLALNQGRVLLGRHWRLATGEVELELPRGSNDPGETPEQAARRELAEETGLHAASALVIGRFHPDTGLLTTEVSVVICRDFEESASGTVTTSRNVSGRVARAAITDGVQEFEQVSWHTPDDLLALVAQGHISDGMTLAALLLARPHLCPAS